MAELDFGIGAQVHCKDGRCGRVRKVVVDPGDRQVTDLVVEKGFLQKADLVVPVSTVERATEQDVILSIGADELEDLPVYREEEFTVPAPDWQKDRNARLVRLDAIGPYGMIYQEGGVLGRSIPLIRQWVRKGVAEDAAVIGRGTQVDSTEGKVGKVDHVLVQPDTGDVTHIVVDTGALSQAVIVPISMVKRVGGESIMLDAGKEALADLPRYTPRAEQEILDELEERLKAFASDVSDLKAAVEDGVLRLSGVVEDVASKRHAEAAARSCPGVVDVENVLHTNTAIVARVINALACDPRTELAVIGVISEQGLVTLEGQVDSAGVREAAEEIAGEQTGVVRVINALEVKPDKDSDWLHVRGIPVTAGTRLGGADNIQR